MYDVKTGRGFSSFTVIKYRLRTGSDSFVPLFEMHPGGRTIWKQRTIDVGALAFPAGTPKHR